MENMVKNPFVIHRSQGTENPPFGKQEILVLPVNETSQLICSARNTWKAYQNGNLKTAFHTT